MTSRKPTAGFWITVALVVVLVGYPLSVGPVTWAWIHLLSYDQKIDSSGILNNFYAPIDFCTERSSTFRKAMDGYCSIWFERGEAEIKNPRRR
jgi:hypothetical protein